MTRTSLVNRDLNPLLESLPEKFAAIHDYQVRPILECVEAFESGVKVVALDAPTGSGKTIIAECVRRMLQTRATYVCHNKELQAQMARDFDYSRVLYGRGNYRPTKPQIVDVSCEDCNWTQERGSCDLCEIRNLCPYQVAKAEALHSPVPVLNSSFWLVETQNPKSRFKNTGLCVLDEADTLESVLMSQTEVYVSERAQKKYQIFPPTKMTKEDSYVEWGNRTVETLVPIVSRLGETDSLDVRATRELRLAMELLSGVQNMVDSIGLGEPWVYTGGAGSDRRSGNQISFRPVKVARFGETRVWSKDKRFLLMSASFVSPQMVIESDLGFEGDYRVVTMESQFPARNRQVIVRPVANMTRKGETDAGFSRVETALRAILQEHPESRILVHSVSYSLAGRVLAVCREERSHVFSYRMAGERTAAISDFRGTPASVLVAPSADRGVDLPGEACRVQVILKVPFLSIGDKQVTKRLYETKDGQVWYNVQVARTMMQMVGRAVRSTDDWAVCYVLDATMTRWFREWGHLFPKWFRKGVRFETVT